MKKVMPILLLLPLLLLLASCQDISSGSYPEGWEDAKGELVMNTFFNDSTALEYGLVKDFNKAHPEASINLNGFTSMMEAMESMASVTELENRYAQRLATELMGGEADYILNDSGVLDPTKFAETGLFYDIFEWMENDPDFDKEDYFYNIFESCAYDGHLYSMPTAFVLTSVYLNKTITDRLGLAFEPLDRITYKELLQIRKDAVAQGLMGADIPLEFGGNGTTARQYINSAELQEYVDLETHSASFDSPEFVEMLEETAEVFAPTAPDLSMGYGIYSFANAVTSGDTCSLLSFYSLALDTSAANYCPIDQPPEGCVGPLVLVSTKGHLVCNQGATISVPKSCTQPDLAWKFMKFCIESPEKSLDQGDAGSVDITCGRLPVNRKNLTAYAKQYGTFSSEDSPVQVKLEEIMEDIHTANSGLGAVEKIVTPIMDEYYEKGVLTPEECAKKMQEKAWIYLNE